MAAIRAEHEDQDHILQAQQVALGGVISSIQDLRTLGKQDIDVAEENNSTPLPEAQNGDGTGDVEMRSPAQEESGEIKEDKEDGEQGKDSDDDIPLAKKILNASARSFVPHSSSSNLSAQSNAPTPGAAPPEGAREEGEDDDIEMGELAEEPKEKEKVAKKKVREELEEGEASDMSSELSELPSDTDSPYP